MHTYDEKEKACILCDIECISKQSTKMDKSHKYRKDDYVETKKVRMTKISSNLCSNNTINYN